MGDKYHFDFGNLCEMFKRVLQDIIKACPGKHEDEVKDICNNTIDKLDKWKILTGGSDMRISFKDGSVFTEALTVGWHPTLIRVLKWITEREADIVITSGYRPGEGVHGTVPLRAFDLRSWVIPDPERLHCDINAAWTYDPLRPDMRVCVLHAICPKCKINHDIIKGGMVSRCSRCGADISGNWHFHIQVHDNTKNN